MFWLATMAGIHDVITHPHNPMPIAVREEIRKIANFRWKQMIEDAPTDVYLTGFILDPRKSDLCYIIHVVVELLLGFRGSDIHQEAMANPLQIRPLILNRQNFANSSRDSDDSQGLPNTVRRAGRYLLRMLQIEYEVLKQPIAGLPVQEALPLLKAQLESYYCQEAPFNRPLGDLEGPREWWTVLNQDRSRFAQPLAVCYFSPYFIMY